MQCAGMVGLDLNKLPDEMWLGGDYANGKKFDPLFYTELHPASWIRLPPLIV